ncbi:hypothetical protein VRZ08_24710 [Rhodopseudomonas sp. G2_2311]|uniref:hypothetical protein n=1 Tax=Rhodopseudomonas sp. G2_2311 TaxID=3114287 RepID=UPI0039C5EB9A
MAGFVGRGAGETGARTKLGAQRGEVVPDPVGWLLRLPHELNDLVISSPQWLVLWFDRKKYALECSSFDALQ